MRYAFGGHADELAGARDQDQLVAFIEWFYTRYQPDSPLRRLNEDMVNLRGGFEGMGGNAPLGEISEAVQIPLGHEYRPQMGLDTTLDQALLILVESRAVVDVPHDDEAISYFLRQHSVENRPEPPSLGNDFFPIVVGLLLIGRVGLF